MSLFFIGLKCIKFMQESFKVSYTNLFYYRLKNFLRTELFSTPIANLFNSSRYKCIKLSLLRFILILCTKLVSHQFVYGHLDDKMNGYKPVAEKTDLSHN